MSGRHVRCTVESMNYSACGLVPGDHFDVIDGRISIPSGRPFCVYAISGVTPMLKSRVGEEGDEWLRSGPLVACPDPPEALHMRLELVEDGS